MPFWTLFWLIAPPVVLFSITLIHFFATKEKGE